MMSGRSLLQKVKMIVQFSLAFLANLVFKIGSIAIISTFLKGYVIIYICLGIIICTIVAIYHFKNTRKNERSGHASCSGQGRKCRLRFTSAANLRAHTSQLRSGRLILY